MTNFSSFLKAVLAAALVVAGSANVMAADNDGTRQFLHWNTNNGLSNNTVTCFLRVRQGYLWVATENGLNRYNGNRFKTYMMPAYWQGDIRSLQEDASGDVWLERYGVYARYDHTKDAIDTNVAQYLKERLGIDPGDSYKIFTDRSSDLWVLTSTEINHYSFWTKSLRRTPVSFLKGCNVGDLIVTDDGDNIIVKQSPLKIVSVEKRSFTTKEIDVDPAIKSSVMGERCEIYADEFGGIWLYTTYGDDIYRLAKGSATWQKITLPTQNRDIQNSIRRIQSDYKGKIWIATDKFGLFTYDLGSGAIENFHKDNSKFTSLESNNVNTVYPDDVGNIWIGYYKGGMSVTSEKMTRRFRVRYHQLGDVITLFSDSRGNTWLGTDGDGLWLDHGGELTHYLPGQTISAITEDQRGRMWIGTFHNGVFCIDGGRVVNYNASNSAVPDNAVLALQPDRVGNVWLGTQNASLAKMVCDASGLVSVESAWDGTTALCFAYDGKNNLYVGTYFGLSLVDIASSKMTEIKDNDGKWLFTNMGVQSLMLEEQASRLWIASPPVLTMLDTKANKAYELGVKDGLCDDIVNGITVLDKDKIVVSTSKGLSHIYIIYDGNGEPQFSIESFTQSMGLDCTHFNRHANTQLANGNVLLGTPDGCLELDKSMFPARKTGDEAVVVRFTGLTISGANIQPDSLYDGRMILDQPVDLISELHLSHDDHQVMFFFSLSELIPTADTRYAYRILGLQDEWLFTNFSNITITTFPPGEYTLQVRLADDIDSSNMATLRIVVPPPFYRTTLAYTIYIILLIVLAIGSLLYLRKRQHNKLAEHQKQLDMQSQEAVNEAKLTFFTNVSHDLRTPITLILSPLQLLLKRDFDEDVHRKLEIMEQNAKQLLSLVNTLLDFRRIEKGAEKIVLSSQNINDFIDETGAPYVEYGKEKSINFVYESLCDVNVVCDFGKLSKIVNNLLSNAFKFTPDGGEIVLRADQPALDKFRIVVSDTGKGISDEAKEHIFERFYQTEEGDTKTGSGIGLSIVGEYVNMLGGEITVTDNTPVGTVFTIVAPITPHAADADATAEATTVEAAAGQPTVLVVDDNADILGLMADTLKEDYTVFTANNGRVALDIVRNNRIDVLISDVVMPVMDGIKLCREIKNDINTCHIPVTLLTANTTEECKAEGMDAGADNYITKPFDFEMLKRRVKKYLEWREQCHAAFRSNADISVSDITTTQLDEQLLIRVGETVMEHIDDVAFNDTELARTLGMTHDQLHQKLMVLVGTSAMEFIEIVRRQQQG